MYRYTRDLIRQLKQRDYLLFAISGSHDEAVALLASYHGFDDFVGARFVRSDGKFTGETKRTWGVKHQTLARLITHHDVAAKDSIGIGDSEGDISMLEMVEQPIAFNPSKKLFQHARAQGWKIVIERKNMIYELESEHDKYILAQADE